jgi:CRP-like cAMP-binding protein
MRQGFNDQCLGVIASRLRHAAFASGDVIFEYGERGNEMFFLLEGSVVIYTGPRPPTISDKSDRGTQLPNKSLDVGAVDLAAGERIAGNGDVFGEGALFPEELGPLRLESVKALSFVSAFVLTAASMREIEAEYPAVQYLSSAFPSALTATSNH